MAEGSSSSARKSKFWKYGRGGGAGGGGGGRGSRGGGGRGRGGGGRGGGRGAHGGSSWDGGAERKDLGKYRDNLLSEMFMEPGICATAIQNKEKSAERELMEYLERVADELYPETMEVDVKTEDDDDMDLEDMLKKELEGMSGAKKSNRFRLCRHETPCVFYVNVLPPLDPTRLINFILEQTERTTKCPFRYLRRIVPITAVCNATLAALTTASQPVIQNAFTTPDNRQLRYGIYPNSRNSERLDRMDMIRAVAEKVTLVDKGHKVDLKNPDRTILIEVHRNRLGISVVQDYERFRKFNPYQLAEERASRKDATDPGPPGDDTVLPNDKQEPKRSLGSIKHAGRDRRAAAMAPQSVKRRKGDLTASANIPLEEGELGMTPDSVEPGQLVEGNDADALKGNEWEEVIEGGKAVKMRREDEAFA